MQQNETIVIGFRATPQLKEIIEIYILKDTHINLSEFVRSAIREKIQRDYPNLMKKIFEE